MNDGDFLYRTAMPDRIGLRRLIQQSAYLSDSHTGRRITGHFCAGFQLPNGKRRIWNYRCNARQFTTRQAIPACSREPSGDIVALPTQSLSLLPGHAGNTPPDMMGRLSASVATTHNNTETTVDLNMPKV
ncbi:MAG: hypothetical protein ACMV1D_12430 [Macromonas sp.]